jgi:Zn-dependent dipeptidase, microsomal dipeptidase homolog
MRAIDLHVDTIERLWEKFPEESLKTATGHVNLDKLKEGDVTAQCFALYSPLNKYRVGNLSPWETVTSLHERFLSECAKAEGVMRRASSASDIEQNEKEGFLSAILTIEDSGVTGGECGKLLAFADWGVKIASLTWNWDNELASPQSEDKNVMAHGLKKAGFEALEIFGEKDIIVDVSHLSDGGFWDIARNGKVKMVATHSNCREVTNCGRNLSDEMIKAISDRGGVAGLNLCASFLTSDGKHESRVSDMVKHVEHLYKKGGEDILALGSDFDGIGGKLELDGPDKYPVLLDALRKAGFGERVLEKMWNKNILRLL